MPELTAPWAEPVHQRLRTWRAGRPLVDTRRAQLYFPDDRHPRWTAAEHPGVHIIVDATPEAQP